MDKGRVIGALLAGMREELAVLERVTAMAVDEATSGESRAENKYDTRATEASYLAAGQGERVLALRRLVALFSSDELVADLVELDGDDGACFFLLAPDGGGRRVVVDGEAVVVVTAASPVGAALRGARPGALVELRRGGAVQELTVVAVA